MSTCNAKQNAYIEKECGWCHKPFQARLADHKRGRAKFCSVRCSGLYGNSVRIRQTNSVSVQCAYCGSSFQKKKGHLQNSRSGLFFCCREHKDLAQRLGGIQEIMPDHYGKAEICNHRLILKRVGREYKCEICGYDKLPILEVHHIDRDRTNNQPDNLQYLCPNCHQERHYADKTGRWGSGANGNTTDLQSVV